MVSTTFIPPPSPSPNMRTFLAYCDGMNEMDHVKILDLFDDNFQHQTLPKSLENPTRNKEQFEKALTGVLQMLKTFRVILHEVVESGDIITAHVRPRLSKTTLFLGTLASDVFQASCEGESVNGTPYANEYMFIIHFVPAENGTGQLPKVSSVKEFVDSKYTLKFFTEEQALVAAAAGAPTTL